MISSLASLFTKDGFPFLLLGISCGIGFGGTYGADFDKPVVGMAIGVPIGIVLAGLLWQLTANGDAAGKDRASGKPDG